MRLGMHVNPYRPDFVKRGSKAARTKRFAIILLLAVAVPVILFSALKKTLLANPEISITGLRQVVLNNEIKVKTLQNERQVEEKVIEKTAERPQKTAPPTVDEVKAKLLKLNELNKEIAALERECKAIKSKGTVMEKDAEALRTTKKLQEKTRELIYAQYDSSWFPLKVKITLTFPDKMKDNIGDLGNTIIIELASPELMPHATYIFLRALQHFRGAAFHRNAGHVLQAFFEKGVYQTSMRRHQGLAFQEYHPDYPHKKYTLGYAGRPGGPDFYINIQDNVRNHGPGSQGSATEADSCFANVVEGREIVDALKDVWGRSKYNFKKDRMGFIKDENEYVKIVKMELLKEKNDA